MIAFSLSSSTIASSSESGIKYDVTVAVTVLRGLLRDVRIIVGGDNDFHTLFWYDERDILGGLVSFLTSGFTLCFPCRLVSVSDACLDR